MPAARIVLARLRVAAALVLACCAGARAQDDPSGAASLQARHDALKEALARSAFGRPLVLRSTQQSDQLAGEVYAHIAQPYPVLRQALQGTDHWCAILILHLNVKLCHAQPAGLDMALGRKVDQPLSAAYRLHFGYRLGAAGPDYLRAELDAADGPLDTRDYRIAVEAAPLDVTHTLLFMRYSYRFGFAARLALGAYLSTAGRDKVGFSVSGQDAGGRPVYVGGVRGLIERNTMRYYLAIEDYVAAPAPEQLDQRLAAWFDATERWPRQLHEVERAEYLAMKRVEARR